MGNKPARNKMQRPYNEMVEDAISALKDRPGSTQADVFNYLETKYEGRIPPRAKKNLETVIRSVMKTKKGVTKRGGPGRAIRTTGRKVRFKAKSALGRSRPGRLSSRGNVRRLVPRLGKDFKKKLPLRTLKSGKKLHMLGSKSGGHRLFKRVRGGIFRDRKPRHRHMSTRSILHPSPRRRRRRRRRFHDKLNIDCRLRRNFDLVSSFERSREWYCNIISDSRINESVRFQHHHGLGKTCAEFLQNTKVDQQRHQLRARPAR